MPESTKVSASRSKTSAHVTLAVVFQVRAGQLQVLLWQRAKDPYAGAWSLPGGYLDPDETLEESIRRHLAAKVDVRKLSHLEQLETLSEPGRHPRERQLATAYLGVVPLGVDPALPEDTNWHSVDRLPGLAFDHREITLAARERLRAKLSYTNIGFALAPETFTSERAARHLRRGPRARRLGDEPPARPGQARSPRGDRQAPRAGTDRRPGGRALPVQHPGAGGHGPVRRAPAPGTLSGSYRPTELRSPGGVSPAATRRSRPIRFAS